jgi:hypothetical protein
MTSNLAFAVDCYHPSMRLMVRCVPGQIKRVKPAILAVEKVLPLWDSCFPADRSPYLALDLAKKLLAGTSPATAAIVIIFR